MAPPSCSKPLKRGAPVAGSTRNGDRTEDFTRTNVLSRRLKKREVDRRCQRQARERTKSRIAYLEGLVEDFKDQDTGGQLALLMEQLAQVQKDRDHLAKTLKNIEKILTTQKSKEVDSDEHLTKTRLIDDDNSDDIATVIDEVELSNETPQSFFTFGFGVHHMPWEATYQAQNPINNTNISSQPGRPRLDATRRLSTVSSPQQTMTEPTPGTPYPISATVHQTHINCECTKPTRSRPCGTPLHRWAFAKEVLNDALKLDADNFADDETNDGFPIRVLLEGWDQVAASQGIPLSWQILRQIDETWFYMCPKPERLAVLRNMHSLMQYHRDPTPKRCAQLPAWLLARSYQTTNHAYALGYFMPGVRERFAHSEHRYCNNLFWSVFAPNLHLLWPYEFRDCYTHNAETGTYKISTDFNERIRDIKTWAMGPEFFNQYPELYSDIPAYTHSPTPVSNIVQAQLANSSPRKRTIEAPPPPQNEQQKDGMPVQSLSRVPSHPASMPQIPASPLMAQDMAQAANMIFMPQQLSYPAFVSQEAIGHVESYDTWTY